MKLTDSSPNFASLRRYAFGAFCCAMIWLALAARAEESPTHSRPQDPPLPVLVRRITQLIRSESWHEAGDLRFLKQFFLIEGLSTDSFFDAPGYSKILRSDMYGPGAEILFGCKRVRLSCVIFRVSLSASSNNQRYGFEEIARLMRVRGVVPRDFSNPLAIYDDPKAQHRNSAREYSYNRRHATHTDRVFVKAFFGEDAQLTRLYAEVDQGGNGK